MCAVDSTAVNAYDGFGESKLFKVNFTSLFKCGTVEFRQMGASTDVEKIEQWIKFIVRFCAIAIDPEAPTAEELNERDELDDFFEGIFTVRQGVWLEST